MELPSFLLLLLTLPTAGLSQSYRPFPPLSNLVKNRNVSTFPTDSTCGTPSSSTYCRSTTSPSSVTNCIAEYCDQSCPLRSELPSHTSLLQANNYGSCVTKDTINVGTTLTAFSAHFSAGESCYLTPVNQLEVGSQGQLTIGFWMRQFSADMGTVLEKVDTDGDIIVSLQVSPNKISFWYRTEAGMKSIDFEDNYMPPLTWTHVALQIYERFINVFIDGTETGSTPLVARLLTGSILGGQGHTRVGQTFNGTNQFLGRLQDLRSYSTTVSNREIEEMRTGELPPLHTQNDCRCPPSHPRVRPLLSRYCIKNGVGDVGDDPTLRLGANAHPLQFINDGDTNSVWISTQTSQVYITVDLGDTFQVFYVVMQFYSSLPKAVHIERKISTQSSTWQDWQYYADDCQSYFSLENNGPLVTSSSVNCLQLPSSDSNIVPYSRGNITFNILSQAPVARPGHNDFYNTPALYDFVKASSVRVQLRDHYYVTEPRHQYFGVYEFLVTGRCDCNGHAESCDTSTRPYQCDCISTSYTQGTQCSSCLPLYNDKPFRIGDQLNPYNCKPCTCYGHADSCVYNGTLDAFPNDHTRGGGGQCVNCRDNTQGIHCETCIKLHYRDLTKELSSPDVCLPCDCEVAGTVNGTAQCDINGGQCPCKDNVEGRRCDRCMAGSYSLVGANPKGCSPCMCESNGVSGGNMNCDSEGACTCKPYVRGDKCSRCDYGFYNLTTDNPQGCLPCNCDPRGSTSQFCNAETGFCQCKTNVKGMKCDECEDGFWSLESNCLPCSAHCDQRGTVPNTHCDKTTGQCECKANVQGRDCDECKPSFHSLGSSPAQGCSGCGCDPAGTVNASSLCLDNGQCFCKDNVQGITCSQCKEYTFGLSPAKPMGCSSCDCDPSGTVNGGITPDDLLPCDQNNGTCACLTNRIGARCDRCEATYYKNSSSGGGCLSCRCHPTSSLSASCDITTGQCSCKLGNAGVQGRMCDNCQNGYYGFDGVLGRCSPCECDAAGSVNTSCDPLTGQCFCKQFVEGRQCNICVDGALDLRADNPFGCSKVPSQQPAPTHRPISPTTLEISWASPDLPNGVIYKYVLIRDDMLVINVSASEMSYNDTGLAPFTVYRYKVQAHNQFGFTESPEVSFRTPAGIPSGDLVLTISDVLSRSASFQWTAVGNGSGVIEKYVLTYTTDIDPASTIVLYEGPSLSTFSEELSPYTNYTFTVNACTVGGCLASTPVWALTMQAAPSGQADPTLTPLSSDSIYVEWQPPSEPNGVIIFYELWLQGVVQADGTVDPPLQRIFNPSGQYSTRPNAEQESALPPPATNFTITGLTPYTLYQFQVLSQNDVSKTASGWVSIRTLEAAPTSMPDPTVTPLSSSSLHISWPQPLSDQINGLVTMYRLFQIFETDLEARPFDPPTFTMEVYSTSTVREFTLTGLTPYSINSFLVQVCNSIGCVDSNIVEGSTLSAAPSAPRDVMVSYTNSTTLLVTWKEPELFNGPPPNYTVQLSGVAFATPPRVEEGTRFPGGGFYAFSPDIIPQNVPFTGVELWFRTSQPNDLLFFLTSTGSHKEFVIIQLRNGRPTFHFDPQDCMTSVSVDPLTDGNISYADSLWHHLRVSRVGTTGTLIVDGNLTATESRDCASGIIIGSNAGVYIGGLPDSFVFNNVELRQIIVKQGFQGCMKKLRVLTRQSPSETWASLDWASAVSHANAYPQWYGCPVDKDQPAVHFQGQGWLEMENSLLNANTNNLHIEMAIRTDYNEGLLFFAYGGKNVYIYAAITEGAVVFGYRQDSNQSMVTLGTADVDICNGLWRSLSFSKVGRLLTISVDGEYEASNGTESWSAINLASNLYLGGLPLNSEASSVAIASELSLPMSFGGCVRELKINNRSIDMYSTMIAFSIVNFDGCPKLPEPLSACTDRSQSMVHSGESSNSTYLSNLRPFTEHLIKVSSLNSAGSSEALWVVGVTGPAPPYGVMAPYYAQALSGYALEAAWHHPTGNTGLITRYILRGYSHLERDAHVVFGSGMFKGVLQTTVPYTNYSLHLEACTEGGCTESVNGTFVQTLEEKPESVQPPYIIAHGSTYIFIGWREPLLPNGVITGYVLYYGDVLKYSGGLTSYNYTGLQVFTSYNMAVEVCTVVGCTRSESVSLQTKQSAPSVVQPPQLSVFGTQRIDVVWTRPQNLNGVLNRYQVYMSTSELTVPGDLVYNSSDLELLLYRNDSLLAGTLYYISLGACTGGGCTISDPSNATTLESAPDLVQDPVLSVLSPYALQVTWSPPLQPNGVITNYSLIHNEVVGVYETVDVLEYNATGLLAYSLHTFQLQVCTAQGCTLSNEVSARTAEAAPQGSINLQVQPVTSPRKISVKWSGISSPNGIVTYVVYVYGLYYLDTDNGNYSTVQEERALLSAEYSDRWTIIGGLIPYSQYQLHINASNTAGNILSNVVTVNMPSGAPDGVMPPMLLVVNSTAVTASWGPPVRLNGPADAGIVYQLQYNIMQSQDAFPEPSAATTYTLSALEPYTEYRFRLRASNGLWSNWSDWASVTTLQDAPTFINPPATLDVTTRTAQLSWIQPSQPNGVITQYNVYSNGSLMLSVSTNTTTASVSGLTPYTVYTFTVEACTVAGCVTSDSGMPLRTLEDAPEGLSPPVATSPTSTSVMLVWDEPSAPNGILISYTVERWISNETSLVLQTLAPSSGRTFLDESAQLHPYTLYRYRISASTAGGTAFSDWVSVRTKSARPAGLSSPQVEVLNSTSMRVSWSHPISSNGKLDRYIVKYGDGKEHPVSANITEVVLVGLIPYTNYNISVVACTDGGCTESSVVSVFTVGTRPGGVQPPQPLVLSQTYIAIQWEPASSPNGPNIRYSLTRMKIRQPLAANPSQLGLWVEVYSGPQLYYEDRGVSVYTTYIYRVTAYNDYGFVISGNSSAVITHGGQPFEAPVLTVTTISHTSIKADWTTPDEVVLQGSVESFTLVVSNITYTYSAGTNSAVIDNLSPNTNYTFTLTLYVNGGLSISTQPIIQSTADGAPRGVSPPFLFVVSDTAIRVSWVEPLQPNGQILSYSIYIDGQPVENINATQPGSFVVEDLNPYTIYEFMLRVCTVFACINSTSIQGTTAESQPQGLSPPQMRVLSATEVQIEWNEPLYPNGILLRYNVYRRNITDCSELPPTELPSKKCSYVECDSLHTQCGHSCHTGAIACCNGVPYNATSEHICCGTNYVPTPTSSDDVCCGGAFHTRIDNYQCCGDRYVEVLPGNVCCTEGSRMNVGFGDECCGSIPYSSSGAQICCQAMLHNGLDKQCCGAEVIATSEVCCGDETVGISYIEREGMTCCGTDYIPAARTTCCRSSTNLYKAYTYDTQEEMTSSMMQCCELTLIEEGRACCNGRGYNPALQVCADVGDGNLSGCGAGTVCPIGSQAHCDQCNFNASLSCHIAPALVESFGSSQRSAPGEICKTEPVLIYSGLQFSVIDLNLQPWSIYEYSVSVTNKAGTQSTDYQPIRTAQSIPIGLAPPTITVVDDNLHTIMLDWMPPLFPNGEIVEYSLQRSDGGPSVEVYRGLEMSFMDNNNIQPFKTYVYVLKACTVVGCVQSTPVETATQQAPPSQLSPPEIIFYNSTAVMLSWTAPAMPNGVIDRYVIYDLITSDMFVLPGSETLQLFVPDLDPYTQHVYVLSACTEAACANSSALNVTTQQQIPQGVASPLSVVLSSRELLINWMVPSLPNGLIERYALYRKLGSEDIWTVLYFGLTLTFTDTELSLASTVHYIIEVTNGAGSVNSSIHTVTLPAVTPVGLGKPSSLRALSAYEVHVEWETLQNFTIGQYQVVIDAGTDREVSISVMVQSGSPNMSYTISGLSPYTVYSVRIGACLQGIANSCATGPEAYVTTLEAAPTNQTAPTLTPIAPDAVSVRWSAPQYPNGLMISYTVSRRQKDSSEDVVIVYITDNMTFSVVDNGPGLTPFTEYEYHITANNSAGMTTSQWASVTTLEASPMGQSSPSVTSLGAFSVRVAWSMPTIPNGLITKFVIEYQETSTEPTFSFTIRAVAVPSTLRSTTISGLSPYTTYRVRVVAVNGAGNATSSWSQTTTGESAPDGVRPLQSEPRENGRSILLSWLPPVRPNGVITQYIIHEDGSEFPLYRGMGTEFVYLRLQPYTNYSVQLEVCTSTDCTQGPWQVVTTAEVAPSNQPAPVTGSVGSTSVTIRWNSPLNSNGRITKYEVLRLSLGRLSKRADSPVIVYSTNETDADEYEFTDRELLPFNSYQYKVRSSNSKGYVESDWTVVETAQAAPGGVSPPSVSYYGSSYDNLLITWTAPAVANGVIQSYQLKRNDSTPWSFGVLALKEYIDSELSPFTVYSYTLTVCTAAGCTTSSSETIRTRESSPMSVENLEIDAVSSTELLVRWSPPSVLNGVLLRYELKMDSNLIYSGLNTTLIIPNLSPYTQYMFVVLACTEGGCTSSVAVFGRTKPAAPAGMSAPILRVVSSTAIEITWTQPSQPNAPTLTYELRRNDELVYSGEEFTYVDTGLQPNTIYSYIIVASNSVGTIRSLASEAKTFISSPEGLAPPTLIALSSTSVRAVWMPPTLANGIVTNYTLYDDFGRSALYTGLSLSATVTGLKAYTVYRLRLEACTAAGCALTPTVSVRTLPAPPEDIDRPVVTAQATPSGAHSAILIVWAEPRKPNGVVTEYRVARRQVLSLNALGNVYSETVHVYNGTALRHLDTDDSLLPYTSYEYSVSALNSAGSTYSQWTRVTTYPDLPEGLLPPTLVGFTSSTITVRLRPPTVPNGEITGYTLLVNGTQLPTIGVGLERTVAGLVPFTTYSLAYRACTVVGCTDSPAYVTSTSADAPSGMAAPVVFNFTTNEALIVWRPPTHPNGILTGYQVHQRLSCPKAYQPYYTLPCVPSPVTLVLHVLQNVTMVVVGDLEPYTSYQWKVEAINEVGVTNSQSWSSPQITGSSAPMYKTDPGLLAEVVGLRVMLDWSDAFVLNGQLIRYELYTRDLSASEVVFFKRYSGYDTGDNFDIAAFQEGLETYVSVVTTEGVASSSPIQLKSGITGLLTTSLSSTIVGQTDPTRVSSVPTAAWLVPIVVIAVILAAIIFFLLIRRCVRGRRQPYLREKVPLAKRQYRKGDPVRQSSLTPVQSFHEALGAQNHNQATNKTQLSQSPVTPPKPPMLSGNGHTNLGFSVTESEDNSIVFQGLDEAHLQQVEMTLPYSTYARSSYSPHMQRGAVIWPTDTPVPSFSHSPTMNGSAVLESSTPRKSSVSPSYRSVTPPYRSLASPYRSTTPVSGNATPTSRSVTLSHRSVTVSHRSVIPLLEPDDPIIPLETYIGDTSDDSIKKSQFEDTSSEDEGGWETALHESGTYEDSDVSTSETDESLQPSIFNDTHL